MTIQILAGVTHGSRLRVSVEEIMARQRVTPLVAERSEEQATTAQQRLQRAREAYRKKIGVVTFREPDYWCYGHMVTGPTISTPASEAESVRKKWPDG